MPVPAPVTTANFCVSAMIFLAVRFLPTNWRAISSHWRKAGAGSPYAPRAAPTTSARAIGKVGLARLDAEVQFGPQRVTRDDGEIDRQAYREIRAHGRVH